MYPQQIINKVVLISTFNPRLLRGNIESFMRASLSKITFYDSVELINKMHNGFEKWQRIRNTIKEIMMEWE